MAHHLMNIIFTRLYVCMYHTLDNLDVPPRVIKITNSYSLDILYYCTVHHIHWKYSVH